MDLSPAINAALDEIVELEFSREDLGDLLEKYQTFLAQLDSEGLYDPDDLKEVSQDVSMIDALLRIEQAFEQPVTLSNIEALKDATMNINPIISYDFRFRLVDIIMHAPVHKYVLVPDNVMKLLTDRNPDAEPTDVRESDVMNILHALQVGLNRRKYAERICRVIFQKDLY